MQKWLLNLQEIPSRIKSLNRSPLLRFRVSVISVLAANRLAHFARNPSATFSAQDLLPGVSRTLVHAGEVKHNTTEFKGTLSFLSLQQHICTLRLLSIPGCTFFACDESSVMITDDCFSLGMTDGIQHILGNKKLNIVEVRWKMLRMANIICSPL